MDLQNASVQQTIMGMKTPKPKPAKPNRPAPPSDMNQVAARILRDATEPKPAPSNPTPPQSEVVSCRQVWAIKGK